MKSKKEKKGQIPAIFKVVAVISLAYTVIQAIGGDEIPSLTDYFFSGKPMSLVLLAVFIAYCIVVGVFMYRSQANTDKEVKKTWAWVLSCTVALIIVASVILL